MKLKEIAAAKPSTITQSELMAAVKTATGFDASAHEWSGLIWSVGLCQGWRIGLTWDREKFLVKDRDGNRVTTTTDLLYALSSLPVSDEQNQRLIEASEHGAA